MSISDIVYFLNLLQIAGPLDSRVYMRRKFIVPDMVDMEICRHGNWLPWNGNIQILIICSNIKTWAQVSI